jgi:hypothetical protein
MSDRQPNQIGGKILAVTIAIGVTMCLVAIAIFLTSCSTPNIDESRVEAQRVFNPVKIDYLSEYKLPPKQKFKETIVGGLSGLAYDRGRDVYYAVSDDRSQNSPARFYTLKLDLDRTNPNQPQLKQVQITGVTILKDPSGKPYALGSIDPEAIALSNNNRLWISSEGDRQKGIPPGIFEFNLQGNFQRQLTLLDRYLPDKEGVSGIQNNQAFEGMTLSPDGEPQRLFAVTEGPLIQDREKPKSGKEGKISGGKNRWIHYTLGDRPLPISEHLYQLESPPMATLEHGVSEIEALDNSGHFLTIERSFGLFGFRVKLFQAATGSATDTSKVASFKGDSGNLKSIPKQLVWDSKQWGKYIDNTEGMAIGSRLPDGSNCLLLVSDDNFMKRQTTQFLLLKIQRG